MHKPSWNNIAVITLFAIGFWWEKVKIYNNKTKNSWAKVGNIVKFNANLDKSQFVEQT